MRFRLYCYLLGGAAGFAACAPTRAPEPISPVIPPVETRDTVPAAPVIAVPGLQWLATSVALSVANLTRSDTTSDSVRTTIQLKFDTLPATDAGARLLVVGTSSSADTRTPAPADSAIVVVSTEGRFVSFTSTQACSPSRDRVLSPLHARMVVRRVVSQVTVDTLAYQTCSRGVTGSAKLLVRWEPAAPSDGHWEQTVAFEGRLASDSTRHFPMHVTGVVSGQVRLRFMSAGLAPSDATGRLQTDLVATAGTRRQEMRQQSAVTARTVLTP